LTTRPLNHLTAQPLNHSTLGNKTDVAISVAGLGKKYRLYDSPRHRLKEALHPFRKRYHHDFWALKEVSFEVKKGECIGIIGRNGSGKSTLLQILSGILQPSEGVISVNGKVSALLELGAGFNPEFTGRQNVYMNGALMGFTKEQMDQRIQAIADFADIGEFIDQPVKTYSSGMYVRLAFAAAVNVDPEVLIVDEALSVGDIRFQQKCYRKIRELREKAKCILFVTHDVGAVINFCDRAFWFEKGSILFSGEPDDAVKRYTSFMTYGMMTEDSGERNGGDDTADHAEREYRDIEWEKVSGCSSFGEGGAEITGVALYSKYPFKKLNLLEGSMEAAFFVDIEIRRDISSPGVGILLKDEYGNHIFTINNYMYGISLGEFLKGDRIVLEYDFHFPNLRNGSYTFTVAVSEGTQENHLQHHWVHDAYLIRTATPDIKNRLGCYLVLDDVKASYYKY